MSASIWFGAKPVIRARTRANKLSNWVRHACSSALKRSASRRSASAWGDKRLRLASRSSWLKTDSEIVSVRNVVISLELFSVIDITSNVRFRQVEMDFNSARFIFLQ